MRHSIRSLLKHPRFTIAAVLTLALGIGVNSALFTVFNAFVLKPLPLKDPGSLVNFDGTDASGRKLRLFSYLDYQDLRGSTDVMSDIVAWNRLSVTLGEAPPNSTDEETLAEGYEHLFGQIVSDNYFRVLGADMQLGRGFAPTDGEHQGQSAVVVLSHGFWQRRFQGDKEIVGKTIQLRGMPFKVIGVTAPEFVGTTPDVPSFWVPLMMRDALIAGWGHGSWLTDRNTEVFALMGRLTPGISRRQAQSALQLVTTQLAQAYPGENRKTTLILNDGSTYVSLDEDVMPLIMPLVLGFGLVLLISCANVANLLLARAAGRQREIGIRLALGAGRRRIIQQLITESVLLAVVGGIAGLLVAVWTLSTLYPIVLSAFPLPADVANGFRLDLAPDWRIFVFTLVLATAAGIVAGLIPALQSSKSGLIESIKDESSTFGGRLAQSKLRSALVIAQVATCFALLIAAGLLMQNARKMQNADTGMLTNQVFGVSVNVITQNQQDQANNLTANLRQELTERLKAVPGVKDVSQAYRQPLSGQMSNAMFSLRQGQSQQLIESRFNFVSADYFHTLGLPIVRGRSFTSEEARAKAPVVIISEATALRFWPNAEPLGQHIGVHVSPENVESEPEGRPENRTYQQCEVIGIARDTRNRWIWEKDDKFIYLPLAVTDTAAQNLLVRTEPDPGRIIEQTRTIASSLNPQLRVSVKRIDDNLNYQTAPFRAVAWLSSLLGVLALLLSSIGLYGVVSFMVASRKREIGIRVALGAQPSDVVRMFTALGLRLTAVGMIVGLIGGAAIARLLSSVLIDLSAIDPFSYGAVAVFLFGVALLAIVLPARRATRVDPIEALRCD